MKDGMTATLPDAVRAALSHPLLKLVPSKEEGLRFKEFGVLVQAPEDSRRRGIVKISGKQLPEHLARGRQSVPAGPSPHSASPHSTASRLWASQRLCSLELPLQITGDLK